MIQRIIGTVFLLAFVVGAILGAYQYRTEIQTVIVQSYDHAWSTWLPCTRPIGYRIGTLDQRFKLSPDEVLAAASSSVAIWERAIGRNLFQAAENGPLVINLIYDERQESTEQLRSLGLTLDQSRGSYDLLKARYSTEKTKYEAAATQFNRNSAAYNDQRQQYETRVTAANSRGGASGAEYQQLKKEEAALDKQYENLQIQQRQLQKQASDLNAIVREINELADTLNLQVEHYNQVGSSVGEEFDEGRYVVDEQGRRIEVFQFDDRAQLERLLAHEFGHALGLDHVADAEAIMYRLNQSDNLELAADDIAALKTACRVAE